MISTARTTLLVVSAIFLALGCVDCAPERNARYITIAAPQRNSAVPVTETKQYNYNNNAADVNNGNGNYNSGNYENSGNYNNGNANNAMPSGNNAMPNVNNAMPNVNNAMPNVDNAMPNVPDVNNGNMPPNELAINDNSINDGNLMPTDLSVPNKPPPQNVGFAAVMSSFWDMVLSFVRGSMGLKRKEPPRIARAFIGAAVGNDECTRASACHAGRMMRALDNNAVYFTVAELLVADDWKPVVRRIRRATEDREDCNIYQCNV